MNFVLTRDLDAVAWELRGHWASGRRVALSIDGDVSRVEGHVQAVSPTGAYVVVAELHVPLDRVLAVHRPSRLGDSTVAFGEAWFGRAHRFEQIPGQLSFDDEYQR